MAKMATRKKTPRTTIKTRDDLEGVFGEYATLVIELDRLTAQMELEIAAVRKKYEDRLAARKEPAEALFADLQAYATLNPDVFGDKRSIELLHGTLGFRTCPPRVLQVPGVKVEHTLAAIDARMGGQWMRVRRDLDKAAVLASVAQAREAGPEAADRMAADLAAVGLRVEQDEVFFAEPKRELEE
ncbi:MAG: host-nuclease inhibitor Gam family protein [Gammaproteobacteria bacterium]|jgi:phage host-nuclease inhibitor protein Gam